MVDEILNTGQESSTTNVDSSAQGATVAAHDYESADDKLGDVAASDRTPEQRLEDILAGRSDADVSLLASTLAQSLEPASLEHLANLDWSEGTPRRDADSMARTSSISPGGAAGHGGRVGPRRRRQRCWSSATPKSPRSTIWISQSSVGSVSGCSAQTAAARPTIFPPVVRFSGRDDAARPIG